MSRNIIETAVATCSRLEKGLLVYEIHPSSDLTMQDLQEGRRANAELSEGHDYCLLVKGGQLTSFAQEAREAQSTEAYTKGRIAMALLASNAALEMMARLFLRINKPTGNTQIFSNEQKALDWLRKKRDEHYKLQK